MVAKIGPREQQLRDQRKQQVAEHEKKQTPGTSLPKWQRQLRATKAYKNRRDRKDKKS
jgi:hypothetical protein